MKSAIFPTFVLAIILSSCSSKKKEAELREITKPEWLKNRPVSAAYFYGIGIAPKVGNALYYEEKAKERALSDLSKQISTKIKSEQNMYREEDNKGVYEYMQSRIKATSEEFLEGYQYIDKWEDLNNYYAYYRLSKAEFYALKAKRKEDALQQSLLKLEQANKAWQKHEIVSALEQYAAAIDAVSGYLNEETSVVTEQGKLDLFEESKAGIGSIIKHLSISFDKPIIRLASNDIIASGAAALSVNCNKHACSNIPVRFNYSGGFLVRDKFKSDLNGVINSPEFTYDTNTKETLKASIDLKTLGRQVTRNLMVRRLMEKQKPATAVLTIQPTGSGT